MRASKPNVVMLLMLLALAPSAQARGLPRSLQTQEYLRVTDTAYWFGDFNPAVVLTASPDEEAACAQECTWRTNPACTLYTYHALTLPAVWTQPGSNCILKSAPIASWGKHCTPPYDGQPCMCAAGVDAGCEGEMGTVTGIKQDLSPGLTKCGSAQYLVDNTCTYCPVGKIADTTRSSCMYCPAGSVKVPAGSKQVNATCKLVVADAACGTAQYANGTGVCLTCAAGKVTGASGAECMYCGPGLVKAPTGTPANAACVAVAQACSNGSYADGTGVCKFCSASTVPDVTRTRCLRCNETEAMGGGPGKVKFPTTRDGVCVDNLCTQLEAPCANGGKCAMTGAATYACSCTPAWTGEHCTLLAPDVVTHVPDYGWHVSDLVWMRFNENIGLSANCSDVCAEADVWFRAGGAIVPLTSKQGQAVCAPCANDKVCERYDSPPAFSTPGMNVKPEAGCTFSSAQLPQPNLVTIQRPYWCLCHHKRGSNIGWIGLGRTCNTLGKGWKRVASGNRLMCRGAGNSTACGTRLVLGYCNDCGDYPAPEDQLVQPDAVPPGSTCTTAAGDTSQFDFLCVRNDSSACYDKPNFLSPSYGQWNDQCTGAANNTVCNADCNPGFASPLVNPTSGSAFVESRCINGKWTQPTPSSCKALCKQPPGTSLLPANSTGWANNCSNVPDGTMCHATCLEGWTGDPTITCHGDNVSSEVYEWVNPLGGCHVKDTSDDSTKPPLPFVFAPQNYQSAYVIDDGGRAKADLYGSGSGNSYEQVHLKLSRCPGLPQDGSASPPFAIRLVNTGKYLCRDNSLVSVQGSWKTLTGYPLYWQGTLPDGDAHLCCWQRVTTSPACDGQHDSIAAAGVDGADTWLVCHFYWFMYAGTYGSTEDNNDFCWGYPQG